MTHQLPDALIWVMLAIALVAPIISTATIYLLRKFHDLLPD